MPTSTLCSMRGAKLGWIRRRVAPLVHRALLIVILCLHAWSPSQVFPQIGADVQHWVPAWIASPVPDGDLHLSHQSIREIVHPALNGNEVSIRLSNAFGADPIEIESAHIALQDSGSSILETSDRVLTFSGQSSVIIPPGALALSDAVELNVQGDHDLAISLYFPKPTIASTFHPLALETSYISASGDQTAFRKIEGLRAISSWPLLTGVNVLTSAKTQALVAFGDSITDGLMSTPEMNHRWPDYLSARKPTLNGGSIAVLDAGITANRLLRDGGWAGRSALERFDRDVLGQPGVRYVIVLEGINDIGEPGEARPVSEAVTAQEVITALRQLVERAHERQIKIFGATLLPFKGADKGYYTEDKDAKRHAVNEWIRTSGMFDGVIDFDKAVRDPQATDRLLPLYDSGDHLHPNDAGYKAMADAIDISIFWK